MIPDRLRINDRQPVAEFDQDEKLFRQVKPDNVPWTEENIQFLVTFPTCVARSRFCDNPEDVLIPFDGVGRVAYWVYGEIPRMITHEVANVYLRIHHCPEHDFYPHCEIRTHSAPESVEPWQPSKSVRLKVRYELGRLAKLVDNSK